MWFFACTVVTETKRAFVAFLRPEVVDWIKREYLPVRESLVKAKLGIVKADNWHPVPVYPARLPLIVNTTLSMGYPIT